MNFFRRQNRLIIVEWVIVSYGILLRSLRYYCNPLICPDGIFRYFEIKDHSWQEILQFGHSIKTVVHDPYGFLLIQKMIIAVWGGNEYVLRFLLLCCSVLSLVLFQRIKNWFVGPHAGVVALGLFALSFKLNEFVTVINVYSLDALVTLLLFSLFRKIHKSDLRMPMQVFFGLAGAASVWFSLPAIFILGGAVLGLGIEMLSRKEVRRFLRFLPVALAWLLSFGFYYFYALRHFTTWGPVLRDWKIYLMPQATGLTQIIAWFAESFYQIFINPLGVFPSIGIILFFIGCWEIFRQEKLKFTLLIFPFCLVIIAAAIRKYPFGERVLIFLVPAFYLLMGQGWEFVFTREKRIHKPLVAAAVLILLLWRSLNISYYNLQLRPGKNGLEKILEVIQGEFRENDIIYVHYPAESHFLYYHERYGLNQHSYVIGTPCKKLECSSDFDKLKFYKRVWLISNFTQGLEAIYLLTELNRIGTRKETLRYKYRCDLYEINPPRTNH